VDDGLWDNEAQQQLHRARRDVSNDTSGIEISSSALLATDDIVVRNDDESVDEASFYDNSNYYSNAYDESVYDDYQFHSSQSHYNKV